MGQGCRGRDTPAGRQPGSHLLPARGGFSCPVNFQGFGIEVPEPGNWSKGQNRGSLGHWGGKGSRHRMSLSLGPPLHASGSCCTAPLEGRPPCCGYLETLRGLFLLLSHTERLEDRGPGPESALCLTQTSLCSAHVRKRWVRLKGLRSSSSHTTYWWSDLGKL